MDLIRHYLLAMDSFTLLLSLGIPVSIFLLFVLHRKWKNDEKKLMLWRGFCLLPLLFALLHLACYRFCGNWQNTLSHYGHIYISAALIAIWQFFYKKRILYPLTGVVFLVGSLYISLGGVVDIAVGSPVIGNFTRYDYVDCFQKITEKMQAHYCLNEWKEIDYEALKNKIMPKVEAARENRDPVAFYVALTEYCYSFHDSHVYLSSPREGIKYSAQEQLAGNDYGFSMFTVENGDTIAVLTEEDSEAMKKGIHNGTVITAWNGEAIDAAKEKVECIYPGLTFAVKSNEDVFRAAFLAGRGEEQVRVSFLDDNGAEQTVTLDKIGSYDGRLDAFLILFERTFFYDPAKQDFFEKNFYTKMISEDCGYLYIYKEGYDRGKDIQAAFQGEYPELVSLLDAKLEDLKAQGMKKLVIDARNNSGGYAEVSGAVASLFTDTEMFNYSFGEYRDGKYIPERAHYIQPYGKWKDMDVVVLTNYDCVSAGDGLVYSLSQCPNVTTMGITCSSGAIQNNGGVCYVTNSEFTVNYPFALTLGENAEPLIDTKADRISRVPLDVRIPVTAEDAEMIFSYDIVFQDGVYLFWLGERDMELEYALTYLKQK